MDKATKLEQLKKQIDEAVKAKEKLIESQIKTTRISALLENNLEQAELIFAAKDVQDKLQKIAGELAKMQADVMPIADNIKTVFGPELASQWENTTTDALLDSLTTIRSSKDLVGNAILALEGKEVPEIDNDMSSFEDGEEVEVADDDAEEVADDAEDEIEDDVGEDDLFGAAEPLGRAQKESVSYANSPLVESVKKTLGNIKMLRKNLNEAKSDERKDSIRTKIKRINESMAKDVLGSYEKIGTLILVNESVDSLVSWLNENITPTMPQEDKDKLLADVNAARNTNPVELAGWIGRKKYGAGLSAQLFNPLANLTTSDLTENVAPIAPVKTTAKPLNPSEKKDAAAVMAKIGANMASDKNLANKPMTAATQGMDSKERNTVKKIQNTLGGVGRNGDKVSDFVAQSEDLLKESHFKSVLSDEALQHATLSENEADYSDPARVENVYFTYMTPTGKFGHREFKSMNRAQRESYKLVANGCQLDEIRVSKREVLNPTLSENADDVAISDDLSDYENPENISEVIIDYMNKAGREGRKTFTDFNKANKWYKEVVAKGYTIDAVSVSRTHVAVRECNEDILKSKKIALEKALTKMEDENVDEAIKTRYVTRLANISEMVAESESQLNENTVNFFAEDFETAAKWALEDSKKGYAQCVDKVDGGYVVTDWYDYETTVATFENGRQKHAEDGYELDTWSVSESSEEVTADTLADATKIAKENSKGGYAQHVNKVNGKFVVSDWNDAKTTVASFENGKKIG